jgi:hypothetical protein
MVLGAKENAEAASALASLEQFKVSRNLLTTRKMRQNKKSRASSVSLYERNLL